MFSFAKAALISYLERESERLTHSKWILNNLILIGSYMSLGMGGWGGGGGGYKFPLPSLKFLLKTSLPSPKIAFLKTIFFNNFSLRQNRINVHLNFFNIALAVAPYI